MLIVRSRGERLWHFPAGIDLDDTDASRSTNAWRVLCGVEFSSRTAELSRKDPGPESTCPTCRRFRETRTPRVRNPAEGEE